MLPHQVLRSLLDELRVHCRRSCGWVGRRDALPGHVVHCPVARLERARAELEERGAHIAALEAEAAAHSEAVAAQEAGRDAALRERDTRIAALEARARAQAGSLADFAGQLEAREIRFAELEERFARQDADLLEACRLMSARDAPASERAPASGPSRIPTPSRQAMSAASPSALRAAPTLDEMIEGTELDM